MVMKTGIFLGMGLLCFVQTGMCGSTPLGNSALGTSTALGGADGVPSPSGPGINPGYTLVSFRNAIDHTWRFGGMDWLSDGRMVVATWGSDYSYQGSGYYGDVQGPPNGQGPGNLYVITGTSGNSISSSNITDIYDGMWEPLGLYVAHRATANDSDTIYVTTKTGLLRFIGAGPHSSSVNPPIKVVNTCHARVCRDSVGPNTYKSFTAYPPVKYDNSADTSGTVRRWHHFVAGLIRDSAGFLYTGTVSQYTDGNSVAQDQGRDRCSLLKIDPINGTQQVVDAGLRSPSGLVIGPDGEIFGTDIQGSYNPANKLVNYRPGRFYGMRCDPLNPYIGPVAESLPNVVMDQSANNSNSNSPSEPLYITKGEYAGQMLVGDVAFGGIQRIFLEKVNNEWQGAVFFFSGGFHAGIGRLKIGPDGDIYAGSQAGGDNIYGAPPSVNWCWGGAGYPGALASDLPPGGCQQQYDFFKLVPKDTTIFEMLAVRSRVNGFELQFTEKVGPSAGVASNYKVRTWTNLLSILSYGAGADQNETTVNVNNVRVSPDSLRVFLQINSMPAASVRPSVNPNTSGSGSGNSRVVFIQASNLRAASGDAPWGVPTSPGGQPSMFEAWYTLNNISTDTAFAPVPVVDPKLNTAAFRSADFKVDHIGSDLVLEMPFVQPSQVALFDMQGRVQWRQNVASGQSRVLIPAAGLAKGGYFVRVHVQGQTYTRPVALF